MSHSQRDSCKAGRVRKARGWKQPPRCATRERQCPGSSPPARQLLQRRPRSCPSSGALLPRVPQAPTFVAPACPCLVAGSGGSIPPVFQAMDFRVLPGSPSTPASVLPDPQGTSLQSLQLCSQSPLLSTCAEFTCSMPQHAARRPPPHPPPRYSCTGNPKQVAPWELLTFMTPALIFPRAPASLRRP